MGDGSWAKGKEGKKWGDGQTCKLGRWANMHVEEESKQGEATRPMCHVRDEGKNEEVVYWAQEKS